MKTASLILSLALLASPAFASPTLKADVTVKAAIVTVGDMFDDAGDLAGTAIFRAPAPGTIGTVALADVQRAAALAGLDDFDALGLASVRVARASTTVTAALLDRLIELQLRSRGLLPDPLTARVEFAQGDISFNAEAVVDPADLLDLSYTPGNAAFTARFRIAGLEQPVELSGNIEVMTAAPRLIEGRPAGTILTQADFEMASIPLATAEAGAFADLDQLVGKQLQRQSRAGFMLKPTDVADPTVIARNDLVTVILRVGAMTLTVKGSAMGVAAAGEPVDVLNLATKKILHGVARADGMVEIVTATAY